MKDIKKVSVVVAAYNVENYIEKCISSICNQSYSNIEIVIVDDGSVDETGKVVDDMLKKDSRINVFHQSNRGVAVARKVGLEHCTGDYVFFLDADDWIESSMVKSLLEKVEIGDFDIVFSGIIRENDDLVAEKKDTNTDLIFTKEHIGDFYRYIFREKDNSSIFLSICSKCIRREILNKAYTDDILTMDMLEDTALLLSCCVYANSVYISSDSFYHYCMRNNSKTHNYNLFFLQNLNKMYCNVLTCANSNIYFDVIKKGLDAFFIDQCIRGVSIYYNLNENVRFPYYIFSKIKYLKGKKIIIYGAGRVGKSYYLQLTNEGDCEVVGWVDKNINEKNHILPNVKAVESINSVEYDYIIIALKFAEMAEQIKRELIDKYDVKEDSVIWEKPKGILDRYIKKDND